jgi:REP element-mobilizing transposase RayT
VQAVGAAQSADLGRDGRALALYPVALHAFVFMSNHWHALLTTPDGETLARFVQHVNSNVAKAIKEETGWTGRVWQRRAANIAVLDDDAAEDRCATCWRTG